MILSLAVSMGKESALAGSGNLNKLCGTVLLIQWGALRFSFAASM
jgi:hypothetical protein